MRHFSKFRLFILLGICFLLTSCGKGCMSGKSGIDPLTAFSPKANVLVSINVKRVATLPNYEKLTKKAPLDAKEILKGTETITVAVEPPSEGNSGSTLAVATGSFDEAKIAAALEAEAKKLGVPFKKELIQGKTFYFSFENAETANVFLNPNEVLIGSVVEVKAALDRLDKKSDSLKTKMPELVKLYEKRDASRGLWVGLIPSEKLLPMDGGAAMMVVKDLKTVTLTVDGANKEIAVELIATATDATKAKGISDLINGYKATFGMTLASMNPQLAELLQKLQVNAEGNLVKVSLKVPESLIEKLSAGPAGAPTGEGLPPPPAPPPPPPAAPAEPTR